MNTVEREAVRTTAMLLAAEKWPPQYAKAPKQHAQLIKNQAQMQLVLHKAFKTLAGKASDLINTDHYNYQLHESQKAKLAKQLLAYDVSVIMNDSQLDEFDGLAINVTLVPVSNMIASGFDSGKATYARAVTQPKSLEQTIHDLGTDQVAAMVGKKVVRNADGTVKAIIDNPNTAYNITETVRNDIATSIKQSLALGRTSEEAAAELADIIGDPYRAERIANTEAVKAYNSGIDEYGRQTDAVEEEWEDAGASDECADYASQGPQPFGTGWDGLDGPPAHTNCRCAKRLIYQDEIDGRESDVVTEGDE